MPSIFSTPTFTFPYLDLKFPGQYSEEKILFVTREAKIMLYLRLSGIIASTLILLLMINALTDSLVNSFSSLSQLSTLIFLLSYSLALLFSLIASIWTYSLWRKSLFIITTRRLTKFIHTTPWNRYQLSLGLDKIVDTGAYQKGFVQSLFKLGYFVARSSAGNIKNFKIVNIAFAEDLHNYVNKLLFTFTNETAKLDNFRPFIPHLKGEARKQFVEKTAPQYSRKS